MLDDVSSCKSRVMLQCRHGSWSFSLHLSLRVVTSVRSEMTCWGLVDRKTFFTNSYRTLSSVETILHLISTFVVNVCEYGRATIANCNDGDLTRNAARYALINSRGRFRASTYGAK